MPIPTIVSAPTIKWDYEFFCLYPRDADGFPINPGPGWTRMLQSSGNAYETTTVVAESVSTHSSQAGNISWQGGGIPFASMGAVGAGGLGNFHGISFDGARGFCDTGSLGALPAGASRTSLYKGYWLRVLMRSSTATPNNKNGLVICPTNNTNQTAWPALALIGIFNRGGVSFIGDGAGQWVYRSWDSAAPGTIRETVALPAHNVQDWNQFEFFFKGQSPGVAASVEIVFNNVLIGTRNWLGVLLEDYGANDWCMCPYFFGGDANNVEISGIHARLGAFDRHGVPLP